MAGIIDKIILLFSCLLIYILQTGLSFAVIPFIIALILSCLFTYFEKDYFHLISITAYCILSFFFPENIIYLPLLLYDVFRSRFQFAAIFVPILILVADIPVSIIFLTIMLILISYLLKYKTDKIDLFQFDYNELRDSSSSYSTLMREKNLSLLRNMDYEINLATLNERNRIAREIHDNIGHLLSRALLQVGALLTITNDDLHRESLHALKDSLSMGMDDIRKSIHHMYDESIDLYMQLEQLIKNFTYCPVHFVYDLTSPPPLEVKYSLIAIVKEALANIIRHSNASQAEIRLQEHPALYQLMIQDNGTLDKKTKEQIQLLLDNQGPLYGIGLQNMANRVHGLGGLFNLSLDEGFRIFVSIPKKTDN